MKYLIWRQVVRLRSVGERDDRVGADADSEDSR